MSQLVEALGHFFGRVEILARGAEADRRAAETALARDRPLEAREHAREMLHQVPGSPVGLALWADAAERAWLDHEVVEALSQLALRVPWRADVWLRLGRAAQRTADPRAREALERAASAPEERDAARLALLDLCDLDLLAGDVARAQRWLDSVPQAMTGGPDVDVALRRAECAALRGDAEAAATALAMVGDPDDLVIAGRAALVRARLAAIRGQTASAGPERAAAMAAAVRAFVLDAPGSSDLLAWLVAGSRDAAEVAELRAIVEGMGVARAPAWEAAFAFAEGRRADARQALVRALGAGDPRAAAALAQLAIEGRDPMAVAALAAHDPALVPAELRTIGEAARALENGADPEGARVALDRLDTVASGELTGWVDELRAAAARAWTEGATAAWPAVLAELGRAARALDRLDRVGAIEALALERERPLRAAVVGEFNAGKSTFLNALLGVDVAPTGILPTTATLHWVAWAPDPFARVAVRGAPDRVVPHEGLKGALTELQEAKVAIDRVFIYAPIERLRFVEVIDTPGFNAPDPEHTKAARSAFDEAHLVLWLLDATQPLKDSERRIMDDAVARGLPIVALLNKGDRLREGEAPRVLGHVAEGLAEAKIPVLAPPVVFSARLSLRGRLGDAAALEASHWGEVEELLAREVVDRSAELKEAALRRRAARLAVELRDAASSREADEVATAERATREADARRAAAGSLAARALEVGGALDRELEPVRRALGGDLRPLRALPEGALSRDPALGAYVATRFVDRFALPVADALGREGQLPVSPRTLDAVRSVLAGAAATLDPAADLAAAPLARVWCAAAVAFARAAAEEAASRPPPGPARTVAARLAALGAALGAGEQRDAPGGAPVASEVAADRGDAISD